MGVKLKVEVKVKVKLSGKLSVNKRGFLSFAGVTNLDLTHVARGLPYL